jgi:hypothetical protein
MAPVQMGGQTMTSHLVPALLPPHRKTVNNRLPATTALFFDCDTAGVSQCPSSLPMKFVYDVSSQSQVGRVTPCAPSRLEYVPSSYAARRGLRALPDGLVKLI